MPLKKRLKPGFSNRFIKKRIAERLSWKLATIRSQTTDNDSVSIVNCVSIDNSSGMYTPRLLKEYISDSICTNRSLQTNANSAVMSIEKVENHSNVLKLGLNTKLASWAVKENIPHSSLSSLLDILKNASQFELKSLPKDPRTLLRTPRETKISTLASGEFYYFGIEETVQTLCASCNFKILPETVIHLAINIDGVSLFKSTNESLWPILCKIISIGELKNHVFCVGIYKGNKKPIANQLLHDFVNEVICLVNNGISVGLYKLEFRIAMIICDTPAKSLLLNIKSHTAFCSCTKCTVEGDFVSNVCFLENNCKKRTDLSFRSREQKDHHHPGKSLIEDIPLFDIVDGVPIDYMHCILLGVVKRLLCHKTYGLIYGRPPHKLRALSILLIDQKLVKMKSYIPVEFSRKTRSIIECKRYKATEFRLFLLYTGLIILKNILPKNKYNNFVCLSLATMILVSDEFSGDNDLVTYAQQLYQHFILNCINLYGPNFVSFNVHNLLHITDCVKLFGKLDNFSAFCFENFMPQLTKKVRKSSSPLQQIIRRTIEGRRLEMATTLNKKMVEFKIEHCSKPLISGCESPKFKVMKTGNYIINCSKFCDRFVLLKDQAIIEVLDFSTYDGNIVMLGLEYERGDALFKIPVNSSTFGITFIIKKHNKCNMYPTSAFLKKIMVLPCEDNLVCFPLLHC